MPDTEIDIETQPFTDGTGTNYGDAQPSGLSASKIPPLNLERAQHIINKFTEDPSWLANPRTAHAANAIFSAAAKVVGMGFQLENTRIRGLDQQSKLKDLTEFNKELETISREDRARIRTLPYNEDGSVSRVQWEAIASAKPDPGALKQWSPGSLDKDYTFYQGILNSNATEEEKQRAKQMFEAKYPDPQVRADAAFAARIKTLSASEQIKKRSQLVKGIDDAESKAAGYLRAGDEINSDAERARAASYRLKLGVLERELGTTGATATPAPAATGTNAPAAVAPTNIPAADELIDAINPSGKKVRIRKSQAEEAQKSGYTIQ